MGPLGVHVQRLGGKEVAMLAIISDLHLTDGTGGATIPPGAFDIFIERLEGMAEAASWRTDGQYRPIERIDILLLGDILDLIRSSRWLTDGRVRPWDDPQSQEFTDRVTEITGQVLRHNEASLSRLRSLATDGSLVIPAATPRGRASDQSNGQSVPVRIHYMVGNHDWFLHLPGRRYDLLRQAVCRQLGLSNRDDEPLAHDANESEEIMEVMRRHRVLARHGDMYDPFNYEGTRDASSLGDAVVIELLNRFATEVQQEVGSDLPPLTAAGLRELDNVRPLLLAPVWIDGLLERTCFKPAVRSQVKKTWDRLADQFLELPFVRERDTWNPVDLVDGLERLLKFSKRLSVGWAAQIVSWVHGLRSRPDESYARHALSEPDFRNRRAKHIVYGHTHFAESTPLDASYSDGYVLNQTYFNSGTWRRAHRQTQFDPGEREFIASDVMTYLAFYQGDERKGRPYETWSGTLAVCASDAPTLRVDAARASHARSEPVSPPTVSRPAPHFTASPARTGIVPTRRIG